MIKQIGKRIVIRKFKNLDDMVKFLGEKKNLYNIYKEYPKEYYETLVWLEKLEITTNYRRVRKIKDIHSDKIIH